MDPARYIGPWSCRGKLSLVIINGAAALFFGALGAAAIYWRHSLAHWQGMTMGARLAPGCVLGQGVILLLMAALVLFLRPYN